MEKILKKIANTIVLNLDNSCQIGLFDGKMGLCCYLFAYSKKYASITHHKIACDILRDIVLTTFSDVDMMSKDTMCEIGIGLVMLIDKGHVDDIDNGGFLERIDNYVFNKVMSVEEMCQKSERCDMFLAGIYAYHRLKVTRSENEKMQIVSFLKATFTLLDSKDAFKISEKTFSFWSSVLYVLMALKEKISEENEDSSLVHLCEKLEKGLKAAIGDGDIPIEEKIFANGLFLTPIELDKKNNVTFDLNKNSWKYLICERDVEVMKLEKNNLAKYVNDMITNTFYSLLSVNSNLAAIGLLMINNKLTNI